MPPIQVLVRAFGILGRLDTRALTLSELVQETGMHKTTLYNILHTLEQLGVVGRDETKRYSLGPRLAQLGRHLVREDALKQAAEHACEQLVDAIRETAHVAVLYRGERYVIARVEATRVVTVDSQHIEQRSLYGGCSGPVLLAYLDDEELDEIVQQHGLPGDGWDDVMDAGTLRTALARIRVMGWYGRTIAGGQAQLLAVPVFGPDGRCWASLSVSLPLSRYSGGHKEEVWSGMRSAAKAMADWLALAYGASVNERVRGSSVGLHSVTEDARASYSTEVPMD